MRIADVELGVEETTRPCCDGRAIAAAELFRATLSFRRMRHLDQ